ncbi:hypothetical protein [Geodermatophilus obscurus]|uniref:Uncharacterized protein n=1 Tax=Geodermatophilus obscurus (strain ATCC 25078 / DSM 43160 / JCM 3152 / CCUG 61914 / KCC A-0152 / KCTC 9177 / NBRC 13315 / NRRL B-3577 / G-20) TaxID=526225 RepID=D2S3U4_GEOOG|nr:hypothetical protein [Geodermatophilus obscurus]ADB72972.1 hypothetical protein Gobs_0166 [Geodermatophilus obscurus DSM 43160]
MAWIERDIPDLIARTTDAWLASHDTDSAHVSHEDVLAALDAARDESGTRLGRPTQER